MSGLVRVGALGWDEPEWRNGFYPDDLPEDWRLGYYANEFSTVLVPQRLWWNATDQTWAGWADLVSPAFRFWLHADAGTLPGAPGAALTRAASGLGGRLAGVLCEGACAAAAAHGALPDGPPVETGHAEAGLRVFGSAILATNLSTRDLPALRAVIERTRTLAGASEHGYLFFTPAVDTPATLHAANTIAGLI
ncbi:MAG: hypothetical protein KDG50_00625 [Chromatiales bacterium]|nr:hypothetical protein [Chromatiales bacterium]